MRSHELFVEILSFDLTKNRLQKNGFALLSRSCYVSYVKLFIAFILSFSILAPSLSAFAEDNHSCCIEKEEVSSDCHSQGPMDSVQTDSSTESEKSMECRSCMLCGLYADPLVWQAEWAEFQDEFVSSYKDRWLAGFTGSLLKPPRFLS